MRSLGLLCLLLLSACSLDVEVAESQSGLATPKVAVCHRTGDGGEHVIDVAESAVAAHLAHGDRPGACDADACAALPDGTMFCADATTFITCDHGVSVPRQCAPGTQCVDLAGGTIVCDF